MRLFAQFTTNARLIECEISLKPPALPASFPFAQRFNLFNLRLEAKWGLILSSVVKRVLWSVES